MKLLTNCKICNQAIAKYNCNLCGSSVCENCYDKLKGVCISCKQGKKAYF